MSSLKVKICGITNSQDAETACAAGADALGFMFYAKSSRNISAAIARSIIAAVPSSVLKVGVFVDSSESDIRGIIEQSGINGIQLHGNEPPEICSRFPGLAVYKAFRVKDQSSLPGMANYCVNAWLLDSYVPGAHGGTGETFNWELAKQARDMGTPVILAGGLTPENVGAAVSLVQPYGVDVSSGVEESPGKKSAEKVRQFISNAKKAAAPL